MVDRALQNVLDKVRGVPERVLLVVGAGIVPVPVAHPQRVTGRTGHFWVRESVREPRAAFKKEMTDGGPCYGKSVALEDLQKIRDVLSFPPSAVSGHLLRMLSKRPTQLEIRGDTCCSAGIVLKRRDSDTIKHTGWRLDTGSQIALRGKDSP